MKKRLVAVLAALALAGCAAPQHTTNKQEAQARWEQMRGKVKYQLAESKFTTGQMDEALKLCQEVLALYPAHLEAYLLMARIQLEKGRTSEAQAALEAAGDLQPNGPELDYLRGVLAERREQLPDALQYYRKAYEAKANEVEYLLAYVECMVMLGDIRPAMELLARRQHDFEQDLRVQLLHAQTLSLLERHREAGDAYLSVLRLESGDPMIREEAGLVLLSAGRLSEADIVLQPLLESESNKPSVVLLQAWANALLNNREAQRAVAVLERAAFRHPQAVGAWLLLGKAYLILDQPAAARAAAKQACTLEPESVEARLMLAYCCMADGDRAAAAAAASRIIAVRPDDTEARLILERVRPGSGG